jgi:hypothetical protein
MLKSKRLIAVLLLLMVFFTLTLPAAAIYTRIDKIDNFNVNSVKGAVFRE